MREEDEDEKLRSLLGVGSAAVLAGVAAKGRCTRRDAVLLRTSVGHFLAQQCYGTEVEAPALGWVEDVRMYGYVPPGGEKTGRSLPDCPPWEPLERVGQALARPARGHAGSRWPGHGGPLGLCWLTGCGPAKRCCVACLPAVGVGEARGGPSSCRPSCVYLLPDPRCPA